MAQDKEAIELMGAPGSPYTRKMLGILRYRRIPYRLLPFTRNNSAAYLDRYGERPSPKVRLLPIFYLKDEQGAKQAVCDSTPLIRELESRFEGRSVVPDNPLLAFIDYLIEDYADEWLTKAMFHYRWSYAADISKAGQMLPRWHNNTAPEAEINEASKTITELQISRLSYVGSNEATGPVIEESFTKFLELLDNHLESNAFILGSRPSASDFSIYGQLTCLALFDPTPQALITNQAPRIYAWTESLEDLSGYELLPGDWPQHSSIPNTLLALLGHIVEIYLPYLIANAEAVEAGAESMTTVISGRSWTQNPFPYQAKCLSWIRRCYGDLPEQDQLALDRSIEGTDISQYLS